VPGGQPGWVRAATALAGRHQDLSTALKEWWRGGIGTYNILSRPLEIRGRDRTAGGPIHCRANRSRGSEATLNSLRSANKKTATRPPDGVRPQQTCGLHARPSRSAADDTDTLLCISLKSCKIHNKPTGPAYAPADGIRLHGRSTQATRRLCILQNETLHFATKWRITWLPWLPRSSGPS